LDNKGRIYSEERKSTRNHERGGRTAKKYVETGKVTEKSRKQLLTLFLLHQWEGEDEGKVTKQARGPRQQIQF
jgi:hypothetical protein